MLEDKTDIINWNIRGFNARREELILLINKHDPIILCLQELKSVQNVTIKGYKTVISAQGKAAILIKEGYYYEEINLNSNLEVVCIKLKLKKLITIISIYLPPNERLVRADLDHLISNLNGNFIITGDFNAKSCIWGSELTNTRGRMIEKFCSDNNLFIANNGQHTHVPDIRGHKFSAIDLTITNPALYVDLDWRTNDEPLGSDHIPIFISCKLKSDKPVKKERYIFAKADWTKFNIECDLTLIDFNQNCEDILKEIINKIKSAADNNIPKSKSKVIKKIVPWLTQEIKSFLNKRNHLYKKFKNNMSYENMKAYKKANAKAVFEIKQGKKKAWENCVESINDKTTSRDFWRKINSINGKNSSFNIKQVINSRNENIDDNQNMSEELALHFENVSSDDDYCLKFRNKKELKEKTDIKSKKMRFDSKVNTQFEIEEYFAAFKTAKSLASGPDELPYIIFKQLSLPNKLQILKFYNLIWESGKIPSKMKEALIIPLLKDSLKPPNTNNFRPISLLNTIAKIFEKMVNQRLIWELEHKQLLDKHQSGFRRNRSTTTNLNILESEISSNLNKKMYTGAVFFDIEKAYDKLWRYSVLIQLKRWGFGGNIFNYIKDFLTNRTFMVSVNGVNSERYSLLNGIPQGSSLSASLFLIGMESLIKTVKKVKSVKYLLYADDIVIYSASKNIKIVKKRLQLSINKLYNQGLSNGFTISKEKTKTIVFTNKNKVPDLNLHMGSHLIQQDNVIKFLGMFWDRKLNWNRHIKTLKDKVKKRLNILSVLSKVSWGASRRSLEKILKAFILPVIDYGATIYGSSSNSLLNTLEPCLNTAIRKMTGAFKSSPCKSLLSEAGIPSLHNRRKTLDLIAMIRMKSLSHLPSYNYVNEENFNNIRNKSFQHRTLNQDANDLYNTFILPIPCTDIPPWEFKNLKIELKLASVINKRSSTSEEIKACYHELIYEKYEHFKKIFTDGSKSSKGVGFGVLYENYKIATRILDIESIFSAEAKAVLQAIGLCSLQSTSTNFIILSDSLSTLKAVKNRYNSNSIIQLIRKDLNQSIHNIVLCWIPSHSGIFGNEEVDRIANRASEDQIIEKIISREDMCNYIKGRRFQEINIEWQTETTKLNSIKEDTTIWHSSYHKNRRCEVIITRLRIGHSRLSHGHLMEKKDPKLCLCGNVISINHILTECPNYKIFRDKNHLIGDLKIDLSNNNKILQNMFQFLKETDLFDEI